MQRALRINALRLPRHNQNASLRIFLRQLLNPQNPVPIFQEWFDQKNIRPVLPNQFAGVVEAMGATADTVAFVAPNNCGQALFTDTGVADNHDPPWFRPNAKFRW